MRFDIIPHKGAGDIKLGMTKDEIQTILGKPEYSSEKSVFESGDVSIPTPAKFGYFKNELQITFGDNNKVDFIEFSGKNAEQIEVFFNEISVFKTPAPLLINEIIKSANSEYDTEDPEIPYSFIFPEIDLAVWRGLIPEEDERNNKIAESEEGKYFWTIGIGKKGYYTKD